MEIKRVCSFNTDTFHLSSDGKTTFCGRDCGGWLRIGEFEDHDLNSVYLCRRCYKKATQEE